MYYLIDVGGTKTKLGYSPDGKSVQHELIFETPPNYSHFLTKITDYFNHLRTKNLNVIGISCAIPGVKDKVTNKFSFVPNLPDYLNRDLPADFSKIFKIPAYFENDAALAALGEAVFGSGRDFEIVGYITISTGIGGARVVNGKIDSRTYGFEPGHQIVDYKDQKDWESLASGRAIEKNYNQQADLLSDSQAWEEIADNIAIGLHNTNLHWSCSALILGGGVSGSGNLKLERIKSKLENLNKEFPELPEILKAKLGDLSGLYGGIAFLNQKLDSFKQN